MRPGPWIVAIAVAVGLEWATPTLARADDQTALAGGNASAGPESYPPPPPTGVYRRFSLSLAAGPGAMFGPGEQVMALSHNVIRAGWGLARNFTFFFSIEGARAPSVNPRTGSDSWLRHETFSLGIQHHFLQVLYVRGSAGMGLVGEETATQSFSGGRGIAMSAAAGVELAQLPHGAVALELAGNVTRYPTEYWGTAGLNLVLSFF